jgi:diacylglycerol kinase (ATP)
MVIFLNTNCCGGKGLQKWNQFKNQILNPEVTVLLTNEKGLIPKLKESIERGETQFVAAGGDGTVNYLLNSLVEIATPERLKDITIGAIGIGSSNDFHKPFCSMIGEIPVCVDFQKAYQRDVGVITCGSEISKVEKYFLINASIGITAQANHLFNNPDRFLRKLKIMNTNSAILYSAFKTLIGHQNVNVEIESGEFKLKTRVTNLGVTKSPHFSGGFSYDSKADYSDGKFNIHLTSDMNKIEALRLMRALTQNKYSRLEKVRSWQCEKILITSQNKLAVEYDGEVVMTNKVEFKVLNKLIKVCGNGKSI